MAYCAFVPLNPASVSWLDFLHVSHVYDDDDPTFVHTLS